MYKSEKVKNGEIHFHNGGWLLQVDNSSMFNVLMEIAGPWGTLCPSAEAEGRLKQSGKLPLAEASGPVPGLQRRSRPCLLSPSGRPLRNVHNGTPVYPITLNYEIMTSTLLLYTPKVD